MNAAIARARAIVDAIEPFDDLEHDHRSATLAWIDSEAPVFRVEKPATPPEHLNAYFTLVDVDAKALLLVDHILSGLWLPPGGHVEIDEDPVVTARREAREELGIDAEFLYGEQATFITRTTTVGDDAHLDVSLWFALRGTIGMPLTPDPREMRSVRWWTFAEIASGDPNAFDPHTTRFVAKLQASMPAALEGPSEFKQ